MNTQKISSIKIPAFDKINYTLWKKKMMMFLRMANPLYIQILKNGPFTPMERIEESTDGDMVIPAHYGPKDPSKYIKTEKEKVYLDSGLFNKLINDLQLHDKYYEAEKVNLKFLLTHPDHLEHKISAKKEGRDLSRMTLEVLYGILETYELEMIQRKSIRNGQGHIVDGSSALVVNDCNSSDDEQEIQTPTVSSVDQKNKEQSILELEKDELYTLDELDELDQSMAYLARKFSNIRVKKPKFIKNKGQTFNKDSSWKGKAQYNFGGKSGYKTRSIDRTKYEAINLEEDKEATFAILRLKPKKVKKDKKYLDLEAKYEALLKKQSGKAYIAEGKSWDNCDNDEDEEFGNYALMALEHGESSSSKTEVPTLTTIDLNASQYKETVKKMSVEMFHIHTSMAAATEEVNEKNKPCANIAISLDYDVLNNNRKVEGDKEKATLSEDVPAMLRKVGSPLFKACEVNFSEEELIIKQELADEDNKKKCTGTTPPSKTEKKPTVDQTPKKLIKEVKTENAGKKKKTEMGRLG
ncbi:hypothetical protein AgCh_006148 [Apium graveolens]